MKLWREDDLLTGVQPRWHWAVNRPAQYVLSMLTEVTYLQELLVYGNGFLAWVRRDRAFAEAATVRRAELDRKKTRLERAGTVIANSGRKIVHSKDPSE
jgi:hypothetical protein